MERVYKGEGVEMTSFEKVTNRNLKYSILEDLLEGCQIVNKQWEYLYVNEVVVKHSRLTKEDLIGHKMTEVYPGIDKTPLFKELRRCMTSRSSGVLVNRFDYPDKSVGWFELKIYPTQEGLIILSNEITDKVKSQEENRLHIKKIELLRKIDLAILSGSDLLSTMNMIANETIKALEIEMISILLLNPQKDRLLYFASSGAIEDDLKMKTILVSSRIESLFLNFNSDIIKVDPKFLETYPEFRNRYPVVDNHFYFILPLVTKKRIVGLMEVYQKGDLNEDGKSEEYLEALAGQAAMAIENHILFNDIIHKNNELLNAYATTIESFSRALDIRDADTEGHTLRVTRLALRFARLIGIEGEALTNFQYGCLLHDIGKIGIPDAILRKPGPLDTIEFEIMKKHTEYSIKIIEPIHYLKNAMTIPYGHHEKWDGTGYPNQLKGEEIPFEARIFAIVDVFDALTSDRPYRKAWKLESVLIYMKSQSKIHFDPELLDIFLKHIQDWINEPD